MKGEWQPGDVVTLDASEHWRLTRSGESAKRVAAFLREVEAKWGGSGEHHLTAIHGGTGTLRWLAEAFESVSRELKPDEPLGLGAVVEAINDNRFVRVGHAGWVHEQDCAGEPCDWRDIAVVRVLSEGVTP